MVDKPSRNEDEYFAKQSAELVKSRREEKQREARETDQKLHHTKCPKCGNDLTTESYHGIDVDRCTGCAGMWLDAGEAEDLLRREDAGVINIFRSIMKGVGPS
ncbi:MAG: zf-TFIIB domain-containing protein [Gemmatimonadota bacterium]|nr:zf-TFIIB domain-containing protein [Gemmatimonadota bacterium]